MKNHYQFILRKRGNIVRVFYDHLNLVRIYSQYEPLSIRYNGDESRIIENEYKNGEHVISVKVPLLKIGEKEFIKIDEEPYEIKPRGIVKTKWFEETFNATREKLGATVYGDVTVFSVYAPTHYSMQLKIDHMVYDMDRKENGVYTLSLEGNFHGAPYLFLINGVLGTTDPYAKASLPNRAASVVVDFKQLNLEIASLDHVKVPIIMEASVRDFSMDPEVPFKNRGKFLGMLESYGDYGMTHIKDLGITHLQIMPVNDFQTVDELNPFENYNWGYDPMQYMALEGSYSSNVHKPMQVLEDFAKMVDGYHKAGIGINVDVVFNHVYEVDPHPFNLLVPYYYFRYDENYNLSNGSFCGNEVASEMKMTRKYIVETIKYFVETFKIDGFRFDLMGLMDVLTMNLIKKTIEPINPHVMLYGEGWKMPTVLPDHLQAHMYNNKWMNDIAHFNDRFRDCIGGPLNEGDLGFAGGNLSLMDDVKAAMAGNSSLTYNEIVFDDYRKSINYVECHDNMTVADKIALSPFDYKKSQFILGMILFSLGIPLIQIGQSFFRNKLGVANSYNAPDHINRIKWHYLDDYRNMNEKVKSWIKIRKEVFSQERAYHFESHGPELHFIYGDTRFIFDPHSDSIFTNR